MPTDPLSAEFVIPTRDQIRDRYLRDYKLRNPAADVSPGTSPYLDASTLADQLTGVYAIAQRSAERGLISRADGAFLDALGDSLGTTRRAAVGASGFVRVTTSAGGAQLFSGDELRNKAGLRYVITRTAQVFTGDLVPVTGVDTGSASNLPPDSVMTFTSGRPGLSPTALVALSAGAGLTGGGPAESDADFQARLLALRKLRPASGNEDDYLFEIARTPGLGVEQGFVYPAVLGPGTIGVAFTVATDDPSVSRRPTPAQLQLVEDHLAVTMPADDMIFVATVAQDPLTVAMRVSWRQAALGWADQSPWPPYYPARAPGDLSGPGAISIRFDRPRTATTLELTTTNGVYAGVPAPVAGQTIAFYVPAEKRFAMKRIASVQGSGPWTVVVDATNAASDTRYAPFAGQRAMPYSPQLAGAAQPVWDFVSGMGPGEMITRATADSLRQTRVPPQPAEWPSVIDNRLLAGVLARPEVLSATALEGFDHVQPAPSAGALVYLTELTDLALFA